MNKTSSHVFYFYAIKIRRCGRISNNRLINVESCATQKLHKILIKMFRFSAFANILNDISPGCLFNTSPLHIILITTKYLTTLK